MASAHAAGLKNDAFPTRMLAMCAALTLALGGLGGWNAWSMYDDFRELASNQMRLMSLSGEIMLLDEVLTMSARMSAATGDTRWQQRYDQSDPVLTAKIEEAIALAPDAYGVGAAAETSVANEKLVAMERRAFGLVRNGALQAATTVLYSPEYVHQKQIYAKGMTQSRRVAEQRIAALLAAFDRRAVASSSIGAAFLILLAGCWIHIGRMIRGHLRARAEAQSALQEVNANLEDKVRERTAALGQSLETLRKTQADLIAISRRAGKAEVATAVLHNVGNVLNSVNVSSSFAADLVRSSKVGGLAKASQMFAVHAHDLPAFLTDDPRGKHLPEYLCAVAGHLKEEQQLLLAELESLQNNVDHIKVIVSRQQEHEAPEPMLETLKPEQIADAAIELVKRSCDQDGIVLERSYEAVPSIAIDRHKALQILVNLLNNARQALVANDGTSRCIKVSIRGAEPERFAIEVEDNGCGIAEASVPKLFQHGFSTKVDGHGLGLHSSACMAKEIGGALSGASDGPGRGARFTLLLPMNPAA